MKKRKTGRSKLQWKRVDLHLHTPASTDYLEPGVSYLDILRAAERKGLDIIAFTDHNTVAGYRAMLDEIEAVVLLERLGRLQPEEERRLKEYRRLRKKVLVLPGFEFTATLGFHILGLFSPETDVRELEFILRLLNIPLDKLDLGSTEVGATTDVLTAYRVIDESGGIVIAAHADSTHGVAMRRLGFGGQTRIAYTQDPHLHALEVTDLEKRGRRTTARFFDGSRPEYPRRMHCIQGSDAHRL
ncbi:MAG: PHP domain-containing protein, partial [Chloroflexi bacterium]|nr:PHP domain-containing protein [Chloroflexota bacterium]